MKHVDLSTESGDVVPQFLVADWTRFVLPSRPEPGKNRSFL